MKQHALFNVFADLLRDIFDAENQIILKLPDIIQTASNATLKDALSQHLEETKTQIQHLKDIFKALNENPTGADCLGMRAIFEEGKRETSKSLPANVKDVCIIIACQKVEHYEISNYGSACALAHHLNNMNTDDRIDFDEIADILQEILDEEMAADEKLTHIAEGGFFSEGINTAAEKEAPSFTNLKSDRTVY